MTLLGILSVLLPALLFHFAMWLLLASGLLSCLELRHPGAYAAMGGSSLRLRNGLSGSRVMLKFALRREHRSFKDPLLSIMSFCLLGYTLCTCFAFGALILMAAKALLVSGAMA